MKDAAIAAWVLGKLLEEAVMEAADVAAAIVFNVLMASIEFAGLTAVVLSLATAMNEDVLCCKFDACASIWDVNYSMMKND